MTAARLGGAGEVAEQPGRQGGLPVMSLKKKVGETNRWAFQVGEMACAKAQKYRVL